MECNPVGNAIASPDESEHVDKADGRTCQVSGATERDDDTVASCRVHTGIHMHELKRSSFGKTINEQNHLLCVDGESTRCFELHDLHVVRNVRYPQHGLAHGYDMT